jgi:hypothetical protein
MRLGSAHGTIIPEVHHVSNAQPFAKVRTRKPSNYQSEWALVAKKLIYRSETQRSNPLNNVIGHGR